MKANRNSAKPDWQVDGTTITVRVPMTFVRRRGRKVIVAPTAVMPARWRGQAPRR